MNSPELKRENKTENRSNKITMVTSDFIGNSLIINTANPIVIRHNEPP